MSVVERTLEEAASQTATTLEEHLSDREPRHWLWDLAADYPARGGKAIRPALCLAACRAFGGDTADALPSAAAIEMLHNAFLVHDDIEDESTRRRGGPTLHTSAGVPLAINAGDAMAMAALTILRENQRLLGVRMADRVMREFETTLQHTVEGQAIELGWRRDVVVDLEPDDYLDLIMRKTCWYTTIHPLRVGAMIGSWNRAALEPIVHFGLYLGAAFQIQDDLLNLTGDEAAYGKEILGDLYEGKRTLMLVHLLGHAAPAVRADIVDGYLTMPREDRTDADVRAILDLMYRYGSIDLSKAFGEGIRAEAYQTFDEAFAQAPDSPDRDFLREMIDFMLDRSA